jgi:hypothetical protein
MWPCIVLCALVLEIPFRAALTVAPPHFTHVPFRILASYLLSVIEAVRRSVWAGFANQVGETGPTRVRRSR